jgi:type II secretory pathway pseudopilin PulG
MVMFVMIIAIMSIMMGVAVQTVEFQMRREREAELIFRGQQYVEAVRLFRLRFGRFPMRLKEIWEANPRVVRKQWKDPITDSHDWGLIHLGQEGGQLGRPGGAPGEPGSTRTPEDDSRRRRSGFDSGRFGGDRRRAEFGRRGQQGETIGPIVGVHSKSCDESIKVYEGRTSYCEWRFVFKEQQQQGRGARGGGPRQPTPTRGTIWGDRRGRRGGDDRGDDSPYPEPTGTPYP